MDEQKLTVAELIKLLRNEPQTDEIIFGSGDLTFNRVKNRTGVVQIEFNELYTINSD